jgi:hypothetical protein
MTATSAPAIPAGLRAFLAARNCTPHQIGFVEWFYRFHRQHGYSPTLQECADDREVSKVSIFETVRNLEARGVLARTKRYALRGLYLRWDATGRATCSAELKTAVNAAIIQMREKAVMMRRWGYRVASEALNETADKLASAVDADQAVGGEVARDALEATA